MAFQAEHVIAASQSEERGSNMKRHFLRVTFTALALFLSVAGSVNLRQVNAGICEDLDCPVGGVHICAQIQLPNGSVITCYEE